TIRRHQAFKIGLVDEMIMLAIDFAGAGFARGGGHRHDEIAHLLSKKKARKRRSPGPRRRGNHEHQATTGHQQGTFYGHLIYSIFWICSRNWPIRFLSSSPMRVNSRSDDFEQSVLASRLNS